MTRTATCQCGKLSVSVNGEPEKVVACHCVKCQQRTGSVFGVSAYFKLSDIVQTSGEYKEFEREANKGRKLKCRFCTHCGTTVFWFAELFPNSIGIAVGCFNDPNFPEPQLAVWCQHKHPWIDFKHDIQELADQKTPIN